MNKLTTSASLKQAVIWDMDGVLSDTQKFHSEVESLLLQKHGIGMHPEEISARYAGVSDEAMFYEIFKNNKKKAPDMRKLIASKWVLMTKVSHGRIRSIPHAKRLLHILKGQQFKLAIASASTPEFIEHVLSSLKIKESFDAVVSAQEVRRGKPSPDIFLLAAKKINILPKHCIVIEDGVSGMKGARAAGMKCIGLVRGSIMDVPADLIVTSLREITIQKIHLL